MSTLSHVKIALKRSAHRGHSDHGWLNTYHSFPFAQHGNITPRQFGSLRVLNEDRVAPQEGFPTHPHRDFEIFSYILSGELTHRDSVKGRGNANASKNDFYVMKRNDVQFSTAGTGLAHSEFNENSSKPVHFLQIWVKPWANGLPPAYHTETFSEDEKRNGFVPIISPFKYGKGATSEQEAAAEAIMPNTVPIHADFLMAASIVPTGKTHHWQVGGAGGSVHKKSGRNLFVHLPMTKNGNASIKLDGRDDAILKEGDGAFVTGLNEGDQLGFESIGSEEAEVIALDSD